MKTTIATIALLAAALAAPAHSEIAPPAGSICPIGYNPEAYANLCVTPPLPSGVASIEVPENGTNATGREICAIGDLCAPVPLLGDGVDYPAGLYVEVGCNIERFDGSDPCGCWAITPLPLILCTPLQGSEPILLTTPTERPLNGFADCVVGDYREEAPLNLCVFEDTDLNLTLRLISYRVFGNFGVSAPNASGENLTSAQSPFGVYADAGCSVPPGCGCVKTAFGLVIICLPVFK